MYPTVADVLALPVIRDALPKVVAGSVGLDRRVRWAHVAEVANIAHLLKGSELVLTTGVALPDDAATLQRYIADLAKVEIAGLVIELGRHWNTTLPSALVDSAEQRGIPLVTLARETRYVAVTESVNGLIVDAQVAELRAAEQVHQTFTALTVAGAGPSAILREVARITRRSVVLETLAHEVLAYDAAGTDPGELLAQWPRRSHAVLLGERTDYHTESGWLVTIVGARGHDWGRLVLVCTERPVDRDIVVAERAASALALHRLVAHEVDSPERKTHRSILRELLDTPIPGEELLARASALAVPLTGRLLVGLSARPRITEAPHPAASVALQPVLRDLAETMTIAARRARVSALIASVDDTGVRALISMSPQADCLAVVDRLAEELHHASNSAPVTIAAGTMAQQPTEARRSLTEADQVACAAISSPSTDRDHQLVHRLGDVRLRGLVHLLAGDDRVRTFAERELGPLLARDPHSKAKFLAALRHYCAHGGNKSSAAAAAHMSRTAYYQQLARIEQILGVSLEQPESILSLYVALLAHDVHANHQQDQ